MVNSPNSPGLSPPAVAVQSISLTASVTCPSSVVIGVASFEVFSVCVQPGIGATSTEAIGVARGSCSFNRPSRPASRRALGGDQLFAAALGRACAVTVTCAQAGAARATSAASTAASIAPPSPITCASACLSVEPDLDVGDRRVERRRADDHREDPSASRRQVDPAGRIRAAALAAAAAAAGPAGARAASPCRRPTSRPRPGQRHADRDQPGLPGSDGHRHAAPPPSRCRPMPQPPCSTASASFPLGSATSTVLATSTAAASTTSTSTPRRTRSVGTCGGAGGPPAASPAGRHPRT